MTNKELDALVGGWDDLKENLPSDGHSAAEMLFDYGDKLADTITAMRTEREALKQRLELALMACQEIDDLVMRGDRDTNSLAIGIMRAHTPARAALGK